MMKKRKTVQKSRRTFGIVRFGNDFGAWFLDVIPLHGETKKTFVRDTACMRTPSDA
jgi:hypothetical protein